MNMKTRNTKKNISLKEINPHPRDNFIKFYNEGHIYDVKGDRSFTSVTTFVHRLFPYFDENKIIDKMMNSSNWKNNKYYGKTKQQIKDLWKINRIESTTLGTALHEYIEDFYNNKQFTEKQIKNFNNYIEYNYFYDFYNNHKDLLPFRTEWMIYHEYYKISGSVDMTFINNDGTISIYDWKRCKKIETENPFGKFAKYPNFDLDDNNYTHYSLQLNIYKFIIEDKYNHKIKDMFLIAMHPDNENNSYIKIEVPNMQEKVKELLNTHYETKVKN